ncbi:CCA tRNA nucleotidyltransferase [Alteraurantiacibacter aquimixticola]|uniref:CCA tRNA nucleotidyltransferase n=1 Tax=Alteraurantiacibacter aquimixticola TaxID=2489173 RepID=A0A4T3F4U1_9SPHN|nr:CCA tRNA nucleotidyltransferase [Alteraurantiacibacter aquimixticola]TIX51811.1 CCA tRNA nucleotidyltransferase [Alteraurantiacibacter aquimixticola]
MSTALPETDWNQREDLVQLVKALGSGKVRWVGGSVRDTLMGHPEDVADVDAATPHLPEKVIELCNAAGIRTVPTGIDHGTVTAILPHGNVEITTLRKDVSTDGRRATVEYADDWKDDAARRDFTINALYADPETLEVFDYFAGMLHIQERRVKFIGDARERIREDHLRILRYFRFQARFGCKVDREAEEACQELAETLKGISRERVAMELLNLLGLPDPVHAMTRMCTLGVLKVVLPESCGDAEIMRLEGLLESEDCVDCEIEPFAMRRLAALLPADREVAEKVAARLKLSRDQRKYLGCVAERSDSDADNPHALAYRVGRECARDRLLIARKDPTPVLDWEIPILPLKGGEIVQRGVGAGPEVARILQAVEQRWVDEGFPDRARVEELLGEELA